MNTALLQEVVAFIWQEADMLDSELYEDWEKLWAEKGLYIVPIDPSATDYANTLNYAYDDAHMRSLRIKRLVGGESISTSPVPRTVRLVSRFRVVSDDGELVTVRCAQLLNDFRKETAHQYSGTVTYTLRRHSGSFLIEQKLVKLINSDDVLQTIGYIL